MVAGLSSAQLREEVVGISQARSEEREWGEPIQREHAPCLEHWEGAGII